MSYCLNTTENYHAHELDTLGWELTVCNALYPENSPCRNILKTNASLGVSLYRFLEKYIPFPAVRDILEIGGGMGYLLRDFLELNPDLRATALDISPYLLNQQKETLQKYNVQFMQADALKKDVAFFNTFDLIIMNENMGDLPTLISQKGIVPSPTEELAFYQNKASELNTRYCLNFASDEIINIGALLLLENICRAGVKYIYLSEHSCEAAVPNTLRELIYIAPAGFPEKISLKGHNEYTIKFSHLQKIAEIFNYKVHRGPIADFLPVEFSDKLAAILHTKIPATDEQEIIQQFVYDLYKYEYLILIKQS
ncbi:MAG: class I SAM-dependent methyltransferase [Syntrophaceae bacterium]|nr:class I SAM-dependent methyltransferase [Syntrophaceae bacterium]